MARYSVSSSQVATPPAMTTTGVTYLSLTAVTGATTLRRGWIYDILCGIYDTPADQVILWRANRQTTAVTGQSVTAAPRETSDAASLLVSLANYSAEPAITANTVLVEQAVNSRASLRWLAAPGAEIVVPAVTVNGIGMRGLSLAYTGTGARVQWSFIE